MIPVEFYIDYLRNGNFICKSNVINLVEVVHDRYRRLSDGMRLTNEPWESFTIKNREQIYNFIVSHLVAYCDKLLSTIENDLMI